MHLRYSCHLNTGSSHLSLEEDNLAPAGAGKKDGGVQGASFHAEKPSASHSHARPDWTASSTRASLRHLA